MDKESYKIGDKVKLKRPNMFSCGTKTLTIVAFSRGFIRVFYDGIGHPGSFPLYPHEIEHAIQVGEQLEFPFMKGD